MIFADLTPEVAIDRGAAYPWEWILYPFGYKWADLVSPLHINPMVWIFIIPSIGYIAYEFIKNKTDVSIFALLWFVSTYLPWILIVLATDRVTYYFYFYPTVGAICIAMALVMKRLWETEKGAGHGYNSVLVNGYFSKTTGLHHNSFFWVEMVWVLV